MRVLFARILAHCEPAAPRMLWEKYREPLSEDYTQNNPQEIAIKLAYRDIARQLLDEHTSLSRFLDMEQINEEDYICCEESLTNCNREQALIEAQTLYLNLNEQQRQSIDIFLNILHVQDAEVSSRSNNTIINTIILLDKFSSTWNQGILLRWAWRYRENTPL